MTYLTEGALKNSDAGKTYRQRYQVLRQTIGGNIERIRKHQDLPLKLLAQRTGIRPETLDYWEMGRKEISLGGIVRIAAALDVPQSALLDTGAIEDGAADGATDSESAEAEAEADAAKAGRAETAPDKTAETGENAAPDRTTKAAQLNGDGIPDSYVPDERPEADETSETQEVLPDPEDTAENIKVDKDGWHEDFEVQIYQAVKRRLDNSEGFPDRDTLFAMEEPIYRMMKSSVLFCDLAHGARDYDAPKPSGLVFLATSMRREAERLYCLFTGIRPEY